MGDVVPLSIVPGDNYHAEADAILESAKGLLVNAIVVGRDRDGKLHLTHTDGEADTVYLLALAQHTVLSGDRED